MLKILRENELFVFGIDTRNIDGEEHSIRILKDKISDMHSVSSRKQFLAAMDVLGIIKVGGYKMAFEKRFECQVAGCYAEFESFRELIKHCTEVHKQTGREKSDAQT